MPSEDFFPDNLKELSLKNVPEFNFSFFEAYLDKLVEKESLLSKPNLQEKSTSVFKFYSNENCQVYKEDKLVCSLDGMADEPYYLPVPRKGDYRFKCINSITAESQTLKERIDADEERDVDIHWDEHKPFVPDQEWPETKIISGDSFIVELGNIQFEMLRVDGGTLEIGATKEQEKDAETNEYPVHKVYLKTFYIGQFPITQNIWEIVMGYNKSHFRDKEKLLVNNLQTNMAKGSLLSSAITAGTVMGSFLGPIGAAVGGAIAANGTEWFKNRIRKHLSSDSSEVGHYPAENVSYDEALEFVRRLSKMTNIKFSLPKEEEWEYAARGGQKSQHLKYAGNNDIEDVAWYRSNSDGTTHPVGEMAPNELGLYDMSGNVWEWTETPAHTYASDIEPGGTIFIRRGGSWWHEAKNCRVSRRYASDHTKKTSGLGLRVVIRENVE